MAKLKKKMETCTLSSIGEEVGYRNPTTEWSSHAQIIAEPNEMCTKVFIVLAALQW